MIGIEQYRSRIGAFVQKKKQKRKKNKQLTVSNF